MPSNGIQAKKPAETSAKTIWYLLVDHQRQLRFGELTDLDVQANVTVAALKRMIKEENPTDLGPFEPNKLEVWKYKHADISSSPKSETLQEIVGGIEFLEGSKNPKRLLPVQKVTNIDLPENGILLVRVPPPQTTDTATAKEGEPEASIPSIGKAHLTSVLQAQQAPSPSTVVASVGTYQSEQEKRPIYNGRPFERRGSPVVIYDESLAKLKQQLGNLSKEPEPPGDYVRRTAKLFLAAAKIYKSESERGKPIWNHLSDLLGVPNKFDLAVQALKANSMQKATEADALFRVNIEDETFGQKEAIVVYMELKNELGSGGDGGLQAALSLRKYVTQESYEKIRNASCCPCIVISIAGPFFQVSGAVFTDVFTIQCFTDYIYLGANPYEMKQINHVAKIFHVTAQAVRTLGDYYSSLRLQGQLESQNHFPKPTVLPNSPLLKPLVFKRQIELPLRHSGLRCLFVAEYGGTDVLVKFCETYSEKAHSTLAEARLAPVLHYCSMIAGDIFMVVMDLVDCLDAYREFGSKALPSTVLDDVKLALETLHNANLVFGDIRRPNIMVHKSQEGGEEWRGLLVDFDWAGPVGKAKYPPMLNKEIGWADGVDSATEIKKDHDLEMLNKLNVDAEE